MRGVVVRYGTTTAVAGVDVDVPTGEVLALLGPSGCGKSSLLRAVAGLEPLVDGSVRWDGAELGGVPVHRRGFGLMFQDGQLFPHRSVAGNVEFGLEMMRPRPPRATRRERARELLGVVGLAGYEDREVETLSGGERQRVALARALAPRPRLLLLDEPLSALDRGLRERLASDVRAALVATGTSALFVTHDHDEAFTVADRVAVMGEGRVLQADTPERLWRHPASRRVAEFLGYSTFVEPGSAAWTVIAAALGADRRPAPTSTLALAPDAWLMAPAAAVMGVMGPVAREAGLMAPAVRDAGAVAPAAGPEDDAADSLGLRGTVRSLVVRQGGRRVEVDVDGLGPTTIRLPAGDPPTPGARIILTPDPAAIAPLPPP